MITKGDVLGKLALTQNSKKEVIENKHRNKNFLTAHNTDNLLFGPNAEKKDEYLDKFPKNQY